jgi:hypothetical protein
MSTATMHRIAPVPNRNGSSAQDLADQMMRVSAILKDAVGLMATWQPHLRDYQIGGDYLADRKEFTRRLRLVEELAAQYQSEAYTLSTQEGCATCGR